MIALETPVCDFGLPAVDFQLQGVDNCSWNLEKCRGENGLLIMFICNHCPFVKAIVDRIVRDTNELKELGIGCAAIMSNDPNDYPEDSFENMKLIAKKNQFSFPYLIDSSQQTAKDYGAVCTPDFFGYNRCLELQYRGRLDASGYTPADPNTQRELFEAMKSVAETGKGPLDQTPSIGCSIKWRTQ